MEVIQWGGLMISIKEYRYDKDQMNRLSLFVYSFCDLGQYIKHMKSYEKLFAIELEQKQIPESFTKFCEEEKYFTPFIIKITTSFGSVVKILFIDSDQYFRWKLFS